MPKSKQGNECPGHAGTTSMKDFDLVPSYPTEKKWEWQRLVLSPESRLSSTERLVLIAVSMFGKIDGEIYPSQGSIAVCAGLCQKTVRKALRKAEKLGWIETNRSFPLPGRGGTTYTLMIPAKISVELGLAGDDFWVAHAERIRNHVPYYEAKKLHRNKVSGNLTPNK